jgi:predicted lipoprotein with Yx(FWY)xxD motif
MRIRGWAAAGLGLLVPLLAACGPSSTAPGSAYGSGSTSASPMTGASSGSAASMGASGTSAGMSKTVTLTIKTTEIGKVLADAKGDTLYWYSKDMKGGPSTCTGGCLSAWPVVAGKPAAAMGVMFAGKLGSVTDPGGTVQATYNGYPLYTYSGDMAAGETAGNGVGGVWHVISGQYLTTSMSSGSGSMGSSGSGSSGSGYGSGYGSGSMISGSSSSSGSASKNSPSRGSSGPVGGMGSPSGSGSSRGSGSTGGSTGNAGSMGGSNPAPAPTSAINGGGCGSGSCW